MAATTSGNSVDEHMFELRKRLLAAKLANEKEKLLQRPQSEESNKDELENQARLQQAMLRRQELLDRIRKEQLMNEEARRPRTISARRRYTPSPLPVPPSRRSLPDFYRFNYQDTFRAQQPQMSQTRHVIEHHVVPQSPKQHYNLPPVDQPNPLPPVIYQQPQQRPIVLAPPPPPTIMANPQPPAIIQAAPPPQIIAQNPSPQITYLGGGPSEKRESMFRKEEFGEMMMMQNAQMHQMVMQKLMLGQLPGGSPGVPHEGYWHGHHDGYFHGPFHGHRGCCTPHGSCHGGCHGDCHGDCHCHSRQGGAVHHHHYTAPAPQPEPVVNTYTTMPAMELRGGSYPLRGYASAYTSPFTYTYNYEDPSIYPGYYAYH